MADHTAALQTPGAGPSRSHSPGISVPAQSDVHPGSTIVRARTPTRTTTSVYEEVELGIYLHPTSVRSSTPAGRSTPDLERRRSITSKISDPGRGFFFDHSIWRTDIITFCSHARAYPALSDARITHVQARKSRRLPFMHEYLLVFATSPNGHRFVIRIDRLGKAGLGFGELVGPATAAGTAIQEVGVYHIQDAQQGVDSTSKVPWLAMDGVWGSHPIVTLVAWDMLKDNDRHVSHHVQNVRSAMLERPMLKDVSGILEGILLEMPNYSHLTTANCYLMTRSSLILLHRCCPAAFACYLGPPSGELISPSLLAEPVWAGLLRWYLPFVVTFFMIYFPLLILLHQFLYMSFDCFITCTTGNKLLRAVDYALHSILDVPLPIGLIHSYMTSLEVQVNRLVVNISTQFFRIRSAPMEPLPPSVSRKPFLVVVEDAWLVLIAWVVLGGTCSVLVFVATAIEYGILAVFICLLVVGVWFNLKFGNDGPVDIVLGHDERMESLFGPPPVIDLPGFN
ncbi:unnamed protein product [Rhizoctonia solani]|uniref:Transmembrane protein n=1 Tax=Rhizoctonia solani TaxID=456999 RepID=A0A8H3AE86_9AGAM|nr:unnamed protein product [Rhizoctonia solani]